ncbi:hypothetical protein TNCV_693441 [Trichonephila clavipes]|nr:hypothetical protein TNCV_693441 [Trichonephila clavipes]
MSPGITKVLHVEEKMRVKFVEVNIVCFGMVWDFRELGARSSVATVAEWYRYRTVACLVTRSSPIPPKTRRVGQR